MNRYLRYALLALLWSAVAAYILYAGTTAQRLRAARTVCKVEIEVVDSSSMGYLVSGRMVRGWIAQSGIKTKGTAVDKVPLTQIEEMIARNGFVERVDDQGVIRDLQVVGGCNGNLQGISALVKGMKAEEAIARLKGINCGGRGTSCPDQFARGLEAAMAQK